MAEESKQPKEEGLSVLHQFTGAEEAPHFYADALNVITSIFGTAIYFGTRDLSQAQSPARLHGILRLSPQMTKVLVGILVKQIRSYEKDIGKLTITPEMVEKIGIVNELKELEGRDGK